MCAIPELNAFVCIVPVQESPVYKAQCMFLANLISSWTSDCELRGQHSVEPKSSGSSPTTTLLFLFVTGNLFVKFVSKPIMLHGKVVVVAAWRGVARQD